MTTDDLKKVLEAHKKWIEDKNGTRAVLLKADLRNADLLNADLRYANLSNAVLSNADLSGANLSNADLMYANLRCADLRNANLSNADLLNADLTGVKLNSYTTAFFIACPEEGNFIGYKKAAGKIVVIEIPADAKRSSATTAKCRCSKAKVLRIENLDGMPADISEIASDFDENFIYKIGEIVEVPDFDENRWNECSAGIHFFINRKNAENWGE